MELDTVDHLHLAQDQDTQRVLEILIQDLHVHQVAPQEVIQTIQQDLQEEAHQVLLDQEALLQETVLVLIDRQGLLQEVAPAQWGLREVLQEVVQDLLGLQAVVLEVAGRQVDHLQVADQAQVDRKEETKYTI